MSIKDRRKTIFIMRTLLDSPREAVIEAARRMNYNLFITSDVVKLKSLGERQIIQFTFHTTELPMGSDRLIGQAEIHIEVFGEVDPELESRIATLKNSIKSCYSDIKYRVVNTTCMDPFMDFSKRFTEKLEITYIIDKYGKEEFEKFKLSLNF